MKFLVALASAFVLAGAATTNTTKPSVIAPDCTQKQRQLINQLLQEDVNPGKSCRARVRTKDDIVTLSSSRLCPIDSCKEWLGVMADKVPDCVYDDTNYGRQFREKYNDCQDPDSKTPQPSTVTASSSGSSGGVVTPKPTKKPTRAPAPKLSSSSGSGSASTEIQPIIVIDNSTTVTFPVTDSPTTMTPKTSKPVSAAAETALMTSMVVVVATAVLSI